MVEANKRGSLRQERKQGFTLVELSIVLVIIGLIIGGILVAQSMVSAVKTQKVIRELQQYQVAVNLFKDQFKYLPGDIPSLAGTCGGSYGGDGNGLIDKGGSTDWETSTFWCHLSTNGFLDKQYAGSAGPTSSYTGNPVWGAAVGIGGVSEAAYPCSVGSQGNCFTLGNISGGAPAILPVDALAIDKKIDDGISNTGKVTAIGYVYAPQPPLNCGVWNGIAVSSYYVVSPDRACTVDFVILDGDVY